MKGPLACLSNKAKMAYIAWGVAHDITSDLVKHALTFVGPPTRAAYKLQEAIAAEEALWRQSKELGLAAALKRILPDKNNRK